MLPKHAMQALAACQADTMLDQDDIWLQGMADCVTLTRAYVCNIWNH